MTRVRVALITGASGGIGSNMVDMFSKNGYIVVAVDEREQTFNKPNIYFKKADLKEESQIDEVFDFCKEKFGSVHVLVNNAAISKFHKSILDISSEEFDDVIAVNLRGAFLCSKKFVELNKGQTYGRIINIASTRWHQNEHNWEAYGASKGGIVSLTNTLCVSLQDTPITVNAISPGWIETDDYENLTEQDHKQHPSGRVGKSADISRACLFLADEKNDFINGANIVVDGGMTKRMIYV